MPAIKHVLLATDSALKAFYDAEAIAGLTVVRGKESSDKSLPILICSSNTAGRKRARNWEVTGSLELKTDITDADGKITGAAKQASDDLEKAVLAAIEDLVPPDDRPQPVGDAITAAAIAGNVFTAQDFMMTGLMIQRVSAGFDEDEIWTFSVDFTATVIV